MQNVFPSRLRELRKAQNLTQGQLAKKLHVAQTTIANYENGSRLPDIQRVSQLAILFRVNIDYLLGKDLNIVPEEKSVLPTPEDYYASLLRGNKGLSRNIILSLLHEGIESEDIYKKYVEAALIRTGEQWQTGLLEVWQEHLISETVLNNLSLIKGLKAPDEAKSKNVLGLLPGAETHGIGLRIILDLLEERGHKTYYLGNLLPAKDVLGAIQQLQPQVLLFSVTLKEHTDAAKLLIEKIRATLRKSTPRIIIGGKAFKHPRQSAVALGADACCQNITELDKALAF